MQKCYLLRGGPQQEKTVVLNGHIPEIRAGITLNIAEIAGKLGVHFVAQGSVRKAGGRVRVMAQLIDARHDVHIWAENYDRKLEDIFEVQDEVVRTIAAMLVGRLQQAALERAKYRPSGDLRAYEDYLRALKHLVAWTPLDNRKAKELLEAVIRANPDYAAAHATLAELMYRYWLNGWSGDLQRDFVAFHEVAARSVQLDDEDSRTHVAFGIASLYHRQRDRAGFHLDRAIQLNPSSAHALVYLSRLELFAGNPEAATDRVRQALRLNPFGKYGWHLGQVHYTARRYDEATAVLKSLSDPAAIVQALLAASQAMSGDDREAVASRDAKKAAQFVADCQANAPMESAPSALGSYEELLARQDVGGRSSGQRHDNRDQSGRKALLRADGCARDHRLPRLREELHRRMRGALWARQCRRTARLVPCADELWRPPL